MRTKGLVMVVAVLLAGLATTAVYLYVRGVRQDVTTGGDRVHVVVAKQDIPAGADLDALIAQGAFTTRAVPRDLVVQGAVVTLAELQGKVTGSPILAGEQVATARLRGSGAEVGGGALGIPPRLKAVTVPLELSRAVGGALRAGDHVTVYGTLRDATTEGATVTLVPDVQVLKVAAPVATASGETGGSVFVTLALAPKDAQKLVFAMESGTVWLGLLPPDEEGTRVPPVTVGRLVS